MVVRNYKGLAIVQVAALWGVVEGTVKPSEGGYDPAGRGFHRSRARKRKDED
jgi:hypothetical protein